MIAEVAAVVRKFVLVRSARAHEIDELAERGQHIDQAKSRDRAAHERICQTGVQCRNGGGEVVALPERGPRDQDEQQTRFEEQGDKEQAPKQGD